PGTHASHSPTNPLPMLLDDLVNRPSAGRFTKSPYTTGVRQPGENTPVNPQRPPRLPRPYAFHPHPTPGQSTNTPIHQYTNNHPPQFRVFSPQQR
ncbi:MAG: hypothetical protein KA314_26790, partial [Chloroflexi bacterium]|nr:hypothetical protein [Chloroflexota bacterium]MBP8059459.1 hypothetical protein [Chloroflexota bacterium]